MRLNLSMEYYLVTARIRLDKLDDLEEQLINGAFERYATFGDTLSNSLKHAVMRDDLTALWEEASSGNPPLYEERSAVLDNYFLILDISDSTRGAGWEKIRELPRLFPDFV